MHKRKLSPPRLRVFSLIVLFLLVGVLFLGLVYAGPAPSVISQPSNYTDVNGQWINEPNAWDWNNSTYADETQLRVINNIYWSGFNATDLGPINRVDLRIVITLAGLTNDYVTLKYYVGGVEGDPWTSITSSVTQQCFSLDNATEPNDGSWSWTDIGSLEIRQIGTQTKGPDPLTAYRTHEVWAVIYYGQPPVVSFTYTPEYPYTGEIVTFNASASYDPDGYIVSYEWDFGDGTNGTGEIATHIYANDGTYTVTLNVTDNHGLYDITSKGVTVLNRPPIASFTESAETVLTAEPIYFNASASYDPDGTIASYFWDFGDGSNATGVIVERAYADDGTYTVTLTVTDDDEATDTTMSTKTVLNRSPVASFTESAETVYTGETITFNASDSYDPDGTITSYFWDFGDGANATGMILTHSYADNGTYIVTLTVTDDDGATASTNASKTVLNRPPAALFTESAETVYTGENITFNATNSYDSDGYIVSYFWGFGDGTNATGVIVEHAYVDDGIYTVTLTVTDDDGATVTATATKTILNRPPVAVFTESAETVYTGDVIAFNASDSYDPDGIIANYFWDFGDSTNATGVVVSHVYADDGTYTVTLIVTDDDGATDTVTATKTALNRAPIASFTESAEIVNTGEIIYFNASNSYDPDGTIVSYFWDFGDGTNTTGVTVEHAYANDGNYTVTLTVTDDDGATASTTATKTILNRPPVTTFTESAETVNTGETITFNATDSYDPDGYIGNYFWDFGDGTNATGMVVNHAYADNGTYTVTLTVTDDDDATATSSATKTVLNRPPIAMFTESAETVVVGQVIYFNASQSYDPDGSIISYFWDFGDGTNATGVTAEHAYADNGIYVVTLTVTDNDGATASASATKTVETTPPVAIFTESAETVYTNEIITFNASASYDADGYIVSYFWTFGDGTNATGVIVEHAYAEDGVYTVTLTVTDDDGATNTATSTKTVLNRPPVAMFTESAETVLTGETIYFNASQSYDLDGWIASYFWDFGDGTNATGVVVEHTYSNNGVYTVTLTVTDDDNDTATTTAIKTVLNRPPVAIFTESAETMYTGEIIYFNASGSYDADGTIVSYFWDFGDGSNATGVTTQHAYADDGNYTVTLTVTDDDGVSSSTSATKTVLNSPPVAFFTESAETAYTSETMTFNASGSYDPDGTIVSFFWDFSDGANATGIIVNHAYVDDGVYTVILTVTDNDGASASASASKTVLNRPPVAIFTESATIVLTDEVITFNASASYDPDGTIVSYFWDFGDGVNDSGVIANHSYANDGTYTVTLTVMDNDGATASTNATKTVLNRPPVAVFTESATTVLTGEVITFNASSSYDPDGAIVSYFWNFGDGTNATSVIVSHAYTDNGTYTVTLTVTDDDGATATASSTKTVLNRPPIASFTESAETVYTGETIYFDASDSYDPDGTTVSYFWDFGDGTNATGVTVDHSYANDGNYTVTLTITDDDGATSSTSSTKIVLNTPPIAVFTESTETVYTNETITFNASQSYDPDGSIVSYFWDFGDGTNVTGTVVVHSYMDDGNYTVTLTVTDNDGASTPTSATKTILNRPPVAVFTESTETVNTGEIISFDASDSSDPDGVIVSYFWDFGDGTNATGVTIGHAYADNGTYTVTLIIKDDDGATATATSVKTVLNRPPVATFTQSATVVYTGEIIQFDASGSSDPDGVIVSYFWDFGDGTNATGVIVNHAYTDDGTYMVTLVVTDDDGATATATGSTNVLNRPPVAIFTESAETVYTNEVISFDASDSYDPDGVIVSYFWDFGDGTNASGVTVGHAYSEDGLYTVTLTVTDDDGASASTSATKTVLNSPPVASFTESAESVLIGEIIYFNASSSYDSDGSIIGYFWDFGDGTNATGVTTEHAYNGSGTYIVTLTVTDDDGGTGMASTEKTVEVNAPVAIFIESKETALTGEIIYFNASDSYDPDGTIVSYLWDFGDGANATGITADHLYADNGSYTVTLTVTDNDGATDTATSIKAIMNRAPVASFTESAENVYTGETITFNASDSYDPDGTIVSYFWDFGDGTNATSITVEHAYAENGTFTVTLTVTDNEGANSGTSSAKTVGNSPPVASFTESSETIKTGETVSFDASSSYDADGSIISYFWSFGDGTNATGETSGHAYADDGNYTVTLTVTDDDGAANSISSAKTILNRPPTAQFTQDKTMAYEGEPICFNASYSYDADGIIVEYFWDFGDGANATGVVVTHAYASCGNYTVTLAVTDDDGATGTASGITKVLNRAPVALFTESAETVYTDETITFNATESYDPDGTIISYFWDFGDGTNATGVIIEHSYADNGNYTVTLTVTDNDGGTAVATAAKTILNCSPIAIFATSETSVLTGQVIRFNASDSYDSDGVIVSYFWDFDDSTNATGVTVEHAYAYDGTYMISLTITDDDGAMGLANATIQVLNRAPVAIFTESAETVYTSETIHFNASASYDPDGSIVSYFWDFGDGANATEMIVTHVYVNDGNYTVTLMVTDDDGAINSTNSAKTVLNRPPVASFIESAETIYTGAHITFNASDSYDPDGSIVSYFWDFGDGINGTGIVIQHTYNVNGTYTVTLIVTDDNEAVGSTSSTKTVIWNEQPVPSFTETSETVYTLETIRFNASDSYDLDGAIVGYYWGFGDGTNAIGVTAEHAYGDDGSYTVTLTVADDRGATATATATKTVLNRSPIASFTESTKTPYTGEVVSFDASASYDPDGTIVSFFWDFGDGTNATGIATNHSYLDNGSYTVTLIATDDDGSFGSTTSVLSVLNRLPVPVFSESAETVYTGETIIFNASDSYDLDGAIVGYFWNFGDGTNATGVTAEHAYADDGSYIVALSVIDNDGAVSTGSSTKTVLNRSPVASFTESTAVSLTGKIITFDASASYDSDGVIVSCFWDFGDGTNASGMVVEHIYAIGGTFSVTLTVTDEDGDFGTASATKVIIWNEPPVASFTESAETVYTSDTITFDASESYDSDGTIVSYFWDFGDATNSTGVTTEHAYSENGNYTVTLFVTDNGGAINTVGVTKFVLNKFPVASFTESAETVYTDEIITFDASASYDSDGVIVSYFWDFGDGTNTTEEIVTHQYVDNGTYTVTLTVTDDDGDTASMGATKTVLNISPIADFSIDPITIHTGEVVSFDASASYDPDGYITDYFWDFGDGSITHGIIVNHTYLISSSYDVTLTITDNDMAVDTKETRIMVLNSPPVASFIESLETTYVGSPIEFDASASYDSDGVIVSCFWDFGDGTNASGMVVDHVYSINETFTVTLTVTDDDGASNSVQATKTILENDFPIALFTESSETVYTGETIIFNASDSYDLDGAIVGYYWGFGDGTNAIGVTAEHAYGDDGSYTVTLTVADDRGATATATATKTVLNRSPIASFTESKESAYAGETIEFNASTSYDPDGLIVSCFWDFGDGTNASGMVVDHVYSINETFTVTLTVTDDDGASNSVQATKTILGGRRDIAIINVTPSATAVYKHQVLNVSVVVKNEGTEIETFNATLYASEVHGWHLIDIDGHLVWYSDAENSGDFLLATSISIPTDNPVLTFETKYNVEYLYDFGFVQISIDEGATWASLENAYTTHEHMLDTDSNTIANLPGLTGTSEDWPEWMTMTFNLSDYGGENVLLGFRYMTDLGHLEEGWYINNVTINGVIISNQAFEQLNSPALIAIQTRTVTNLTPGGQIILIFSWNTTNTLSGKYSISATIDTITGEIDTIDNIYVDGIVQVKMNPDIDGDGDVDIFDVVAVTGIYGCSEGEACWNPKADLVEDGVINIYDVVIVAIHYGQTIQF